MTKTEAFLILRSPMLLHACRTGAGRERVLKTVAETVDFSRGEAEVTQDGYLSFRSDSGSNDVTRYRRKQNERMRTRLDSETDEVRRYRLKQLIRRNERAMRMDADEDDIDWITVNGAHIPLIDGEAVGGAEGKLNGEDFSEAESEETTPESSGSSKSSEASGSSGSSGSTASKGSGISSGAKIKTGVNAAIQEAYSQEGEEAVKSALIDAVNAAEPGDTVQLYSKSFGTYISYTKSETPGMLDTKSGFSFKIGTLLNGCDVDNPDHAPIVTPYQMTDSDFDKVSAKTALERVSAVQNMSMTNAVNYIEYTGLADESTLSELKKCCESSDEEGFKAALSACTDAMVGDSFKKGTISTNQKLEYLKTCSDPAEFLKTYGTESDQVVAEYLESNTMKWIEKGAISAEDADEAIQKSLRDSYLSELMDEQEEVMAALAQAQAAEGDATKNKINALKDLPYDAYSHASALYESGVAPAKIDVFLMGYFGIPTMDYIHGLFSDEKSKTGKSGSNTSAANDKYSVMTGDGKFKTLSGDVTEPSTAEELYDGFWAVDSDGLVWDSAGDGDFYNEETDEYITSEELAEKGALSLTDSEELKYYESLQAQIEYADGHEEIRTEHVEDYDLPESLDGNERLLQVISDTGLDLEDAEFLLEAANAFTHGDYGDIRAEQMGMGYSSKCSEYADALEDFIDRSPKWDGSVIFRGIGLDEDTFNDIVSDAEDGRDLDQKGLSSWSSDEGTAVDFAEQNAYYGYAIIFECPDGTTQGTSVKHISGYPDEDEVLVSADARQVATNVKIKKSGRITWAYITVREA